MRIVVKKEPGIFLLYLALFGYFTLYKEYKESLKGLYRRYLPSKVTKITENYFLKNGLPLKTKEFFDWIFTKFRKEIGESTLGYFALLYRHPSKEKEIKKFIKKEKRNIFTYFKEIKNKEIEALSLIDSQLKKSPSFLNILEKTLKNDIQTKKENLNLLKKTLKKDLEFFNFKEGKNLKITITPFNYFPFQAPSMVLLLEKKIIVISSEKYHPEIIEHEFLHYFINPLVEKFIKKFPSSSSLIVKLSSQLRKARYSKNPYNLLREELIYTYLNFKKKQKNIDYQKFMKLFPCKNEKDFQLLLKKSFFYRDGCRKLKIKNLSDFLKKSESFYEYYIKNNLADIIFKFLRFYQKEKSKNNNLNFNQFFFKHFLSFLK